MGQGFQRKCQYFCILVLLIYSALAGNECSRSGNLCPHLCYCSGICNSHVDCSGKNFTAIPVNISENVISLDLSMNNLTQIPERAFSKFTKLEELRLVGNKLKDIPATAFQDLYYLRSLYLRHNLFTEVPATAFQHLFLLRELTLDANFIRHVPDEAFLNCKRLKLLQLDANHLTEVPTGALRHLTTLHALDLSVNRLTYIPDYSFANLTDLIELILHENKILDIGDHAFEGLESLTRLELPMNNLKEIPAAFIALKDLETLSLEENRIDFIPDNSFIGNKQLQNLKLRENPIRSFGRKAFRGLPNLKELIISEATEMAEFPDLTGGERLKKLQLDRSSISRIPTDFCDMVPNIERLELHSNKIMNIPNLSRCSGLRLLNMGENEIISVGDGMFVNNTELRDLILSHNRITYISDMALRGLINLQYLDLSHNRIAKIGSEAFSSLKNLNDLNLSENRFPRLPMDGLQNLQQLKTFHNDELRDPIPAKKLPKIKTLILSYAYHCCDFLTPQGTGELKLQEDTSWLGPNITDHNIGKNRSNNPFDYPVIHYNYKPLEYLSPSEKTYQFPDVDFILPDNDYAEEEISVRSPIHCEPLPGPFLPCNDLFGWWTLRCGIWIVFMLAIFGNGTVLFVSISGRSTMSVPRFLICNLALADFCMGVYLGILAIVDASTLGEFKNYATQWQSSVGCLVAGFLGVVSSELSVFTLMIITVERHYAIANAMHFDKRISLRKAGIVLTVGWTLCIGLATLPLFDISDYRKFAICLPFEISDRASLGFVCFIMLFNATSFLVIGGCYARMYMNIMRSHAWNSRDFRVAKRMAILVVTDFLCWAPIIFFSVSAAFGFPLIGLNEAKVLTIFVLPLNSCANPFLYAIFTKQFKRDCVKLCKRIEESSISRSFSNFNSLRLSFGINGTCRNSDLQSPFHEKRGSSRSNSDSYDSSSGAQNQNNGESEDAPLTYKSSNTISNRVYRDSDFDNDPVLRKGAARFPTNNNFPFSQKKCRCQRCYRQNTLSVGSNGTDAEIVIHADRNGERFIPKEETSQRRLEDDIDHGEEECLIDSHKESNELLQTMDKLCETCRHIQNSTFCKQHCVYTFNDKTFEPTMDMCLNEGSAHSHSLPLSQLCQEEYKPQLPKQGPPKDKMNHINEWRKSSHLSCLWRNSLDLDFGMPKYKSNSLVELARTPNSFEKSPSKRRSLSSKHEGYVLCKNNKGRSDFDNEELFEYEDKIKSFPYQIPSTQSCITTPNIFTKSTDEVPKIQNIFNDSPNDDSDDEDVDERDILLSKSCDREITISKRDVCDKESGFSSGSQLLNC